MVEISGVCKCGASFEVKMDTESLAYKVWQDFAGWHRFCIAERDVLRVADQMIDEPEGAYYPYSRRLGFHV